jgi:predicted anti-sigma-YlaC factor YlaD
MSDPSCRDVRELLGVYIVGAIEPADRGVVDSHLGYCHDCREELAGLAGLPALLRRVPLADAEALVSMGERANDSYEPEPELLNSLLRQVIAARRTSRLRGVFAVAAALAVAVGGGAVVSRTLVPQHAPVPVAAMESVHASKNGLGATVLYGRNNWGTTMSVQVTGVQPGTECQFWVLTKTGKLALIGSWAARPWGDRQPYLIEAPLAEANVAGFVIKSGHMVLLRIPAAT